MQHDPGHVQVTLCRSQSIRQLHSPPGSPITGPLTPFGLHRPPSPIPEEADDDAGTSVITPVKEAGTSEPSDDVKPLPKFSTPKLARKKQEIHASTPKLNESKQTEENYLTFPRRAYPLQRQVSFDSPKEKPPSILVRSNQSIPSAKEDEDQKAIDRYYENNQYTITGMYLKNVDTVNRIPANYQRMLKDIRNRDPSVGKQSTMSSKSKVLPIPGSNENRFVQSFYWLAHHHKNIGLRHFFMLSLVVMYSLLGGVVFYLTEYPAEKKLFVERAAKLDEKLDVLAGEVFTQLSDNLTTTFSDVDGIRQYLKDAYLLLLQTEELYEVSTYYKTLSDDNLLWNFGSATFFATNLFMTVGYGVIFPFSDLGRVLTVIYGVIFVPFTNVVIRDIGQWILVGMTKLYARLLIRWRTARGIATDEDEDISFPIKYSVFALFVAWMACSFLTWTFDGAIGAPGTGMTYWAAVYFSFITLSSIGLGDVMPNNATLSPVIKIWYFVCVPMVKVVNRITYIALENGVIGTFHVLESRLEMWKRGESAASKLAKTSPSAALSVISNNQPADVEASPRVTRHNSIRSRATIEEQEALNEALNSFTVRSIKQFMESRADVYGGDFGRVKLTRSQLRSLEEPD